ncbi:MAG: hypothetical protein WBN75_01725 [Verrucomicrobiia bacterium]
MDINTVPTDSLRKMFNLTARTQAQEWQKIFGKRLGDSNSFTVQKNSAVGTTSNLVKAPPSPA